MNFSVPRQIGMDRPTRSFYAEPQVPIPRTRAVGRQGRPREPLRSGTFGLWILQDSTMGTASSSSRTLVSESNLRAVHGLSLCGWRYTPPADTTTPTVARGPGAGLGGSVVAGCGAVEYELLDLWRFEQPVQVSDALDLFFRHWCVCA